MMYTKTINGRQVFSDCRTIQTAAGGWISNPTPEQIAAAGWEEYMIPVAVPEPAPDEPGLEEVLNAVKRMLASEADNLTDEQALAVAALFPLWIDKMGKAVTAGERLWYAGALYKVMQSHTVQEDWTPDATPALFAEVSIEEWPDFVQPTGAHDAYQTGDRVTIEGVRYVSIIDNNVWSPTAYPGGWQKQ